jgi:acetylornithine deacetylase/succinyl-diaminopimelate desuccinylase-like protein
MTGPSQSLLEFVHETWQQDILPTLKRYITIPNQSPAFDKQWREHGYMDQAVDLLAAWVTAQNVPDLRLEVRREAGRTPLLFIEVAGDRPNTVLLYGHLDKQPPMSGWREGLDPWTPVLEDGKLFGRGAADDGYATFGAVTALKALKRASIPCARCVILIEACEESGSFDLPRHVSDLADRIGHPDLVICLDSGCGDYERLWVTTSLRGIVNGTLSVSTLTEGVHSGAASGIVPSTFRVLRMLLSRLENEQTGEIIPRKFHVDIPADRLEQARRGAEVLGDTIHSEYPFHATVRPVHENGLELLLNRTWRPQLEVIAADGFPPWEQAGNVLRPLTRVKLSLRLPPTADTSTSVNCLKRLFGESPPYGASVTFTCGQGSPGWNAPSFTPWLEAAINRASVEFFGKEACAIGEGGTIPFMAMLAEKFPQAQFMITGVLGPHSNAHGPNEFLHLATAERLTACVTRVLEAHGKQT